MKKIPVYLIFLTVPVDIAAAQWTPVTAGIRETNEIIKDGVTLQKQVREGVYLRQADGSSLTQFNKLNGVDVPGSGNLFDNKAHRSYKIDYKTGKATPSRLVGDGPLTPDVYAGIVTVGNGTVAGFQCRLIPINLIVLSGPKKRIGEACVLDAQSLILKEETRVTRDDGSVVHEITEKFNVKLNAQPNAKDFDLKQFEVADVPAQPAPVMKD